MDDEYISRDKTLALLKSLGSRDYRREKGTIQDAIKMISSSAYTPAADVAPVVRCKDCKYGKYAAWCNGYACCRMVGECHRADFGCTGGKLKTNGVAE